MKAAFDSGVNNAARRMTYLQDRDEFERVFDAILRDIRDEQAKEALSARSSLAFGVASEEIKAGQVVTLDAETGKFRMWRG